MLAAGRGRPNGSAGRPVWTVQTGRFFGRRQHRAGTNGHRPFSFDRDMKSDYHHCTAGLAAGGRGSEMDEFALFLSQFRREPHYRMTV